MYTGFPVHVTPSMEQTSVRGVRDAGETFGFLGAFGDGGSEVTTSQSEAEEKGGPDSELVPGWWA